MMMIFCLFSLSSSFVRSFVYPPLVNTSQDKDISLFQWKVSCIDRLLSLSLSLVASLFFFFLFSRVSFSLVGCKTLFHFLFSTLSLLRVFIEFDEQLIEMFYYSRAPPSYQVIEKVRRANQLDRFFVNVSGINTRVHAVWQTKQTSSLFLRITDDRWIRFFRFIQLTIIILKHPDDIKQEKQFIQMNRIIMLVRRPNVFFFFRKIFDDFLFR